MPLSLTRHAWRLGPLLLWALGACAATATPARPGEQITAAPAASASQTPAALAAASDPATWASAVASASARPPAEVRRLLPATREQLGGTCTLGAPVAIGKSTATTVSWPDIAVAASTEGVMASWVSGDEQITTRPLDSLGQPRGEGRVMAADAGTSMLQLWDLGDGRFVQAFARRKPPLPRAFEPAFALQRVDASGELVGSPVTFSLGKVAQVVPFRNQLLMLTADTRHRELLRVSAAEGGLDVKRVALPDVRGESWFDESVFPSSDGKVWVLSSDSKVTTVDREGGESVQVKAPSDHWHRPVVSQDDELLWPECRNTPTVRGVKLHEGKLVDVELPGSVCGGPSFAVWDVGPAPNVHAVNNRGLGVLFPPGSGNLLFTVSTLTSRHAIRRSKSGWVNESTWTGSSVLTIYSTGKRKDWTIVAQPITCQGGAPPPAASGSSPATGANATKN